MIDALAGLALIWVGLTAVALVADTLLPRFLEGQGHDAKHPRPH